jgi:PAS domain S-box-containing protein
MVGWPEEELIGRMPPFPYWTPEEQGALNAVLADVIAGRASPAGYELRFRRRDETRFDALVLISHLDRGPSHAFLASVHDITERKNAERSTRFLAEAGEILSRSLDYEETLRAISALVVPRFADWCFIDLVDEDGGIKRIAVGHPSGSANETIARRLQRAYAPKNTLYGFSEALANGRTLMMNDVSDDVLITASRDDEHRDLLLSLGMHCFISVPMTTHGTTFGVITFLGTNVRKRFEPADVALAEEVARRAALAVDNARLYRSAQEANRAKDEFLANLSHELRTPLTAILGWVHLLQLGDLEPAQLTLGLQTIRQSGEAQARLVDELLDVSRIITGKLQINPASIVLADVVSGAVAAIRPAADAKRQRIEEDVSAPEARVFGDASRLQQVFWNLLSNAVKFTPAGGVVRVSLTSEGENVVAQVADSGEGIAAEFLPHVFERFRQAATGGRSRPGLGLGLAIAKELVEMHGGSIAVQSGGRGAGSTFTVVLPSHTEKAKPRERRIAPAERRDEKLRSLRVLLVEDDEATLTLLATVLAGFGATVTTAASASDAEAVLGTFEPQILITDIEMPGSDGVSLLHLLRSAKYDTLPAIAVSGYADEASRDRVRAAGFNGFVAKPLDPIVLADEILRALGGGSEVKK